MLIVCIHIFRLASILPDLMSVYAQLDVLNYFLSHHHEQELSKNVYVLLVSILNILRNTLLLITVLKGDHH